VLSVTAISCIGEVEAELKAGGARRGNAGAAVLMALAIVNEDHSFGIKRVIQVRRKMIRYRN
jgi:hypothetical protein